MILNQNSVCKQVLLLTLSKSGVRYPGFSSVVKTISLEVHMFEPYLTYAFEVISVSKDIICNPETTQGLFSKAIYGSL